MKLDLYLEPVDFSGFNLSGWAQKKYTLGSLLEKNQEKIPVTKAKIALIGVSEDRHAVEKGSAKAPDKIREHLYQLNLRFLKLLFSMDTIFYFTTKT